MFRLFIELFETLFNELKEFDLFGNNLSIIIHYLFLKIYLYMYIIF